MNTEFVLYNTIFHCKCTDTVSYTNSSGHYELVDGNIIKPFDNNLTFEEHRQIKLHISFHKTLPTMTDYKFSNFPKAIVVFGSHFNSTDYEKLQERLSILNKIAIGASQALQYGQKFAANLGTAALIAGSFASVMTVLVSLAGEVDKIYKEFKNLEQKIFNTIVEGELDALNHHMINLANPMTLDGQKVSELVNSVSTLRKLLPFFAKEDSIFRERYYVGAPLFVRLCAILKAISLIEANSNTFNDNLQGLREGYQKVLDWYKIKCTGTRLASCYVNGMLTLPGGDWTNDWERHYESHKKYYDNGSPLM